MLKLKSGLIRIALCQTQVTNNVATNLAQAEAAIGQAAQAGARLVVLPECFNCPYGNESFRANAEIVPSLGEAVEKTSTSMSMLKEAARRNRVWIIGGSVPERENSKLYNTCAVFNSQGVMVAKYRKMHLFDVDIPGRITFRESDTLSAGSEMAAFDFKSEDAACRVGLGICYDLRFPEFSATLTANDCSLLVFPAAFNMTTGSAHWELLIRSRALDNQVYVAAVAPARNKSSGYQAWGHSTLCGPWGDVHITTGHEPDLLIKDIDLNAIASIRQQIPITKQKRPDLYKF